MHELSSARGPTHSALHRRRCSSSLALRGGLALDAVSVFLSRRTMRYTVLPGTDIRVSVIAMGCWALAGDMTWGDQSEADSIAAVRAALDAGITFFDTAPGYGDGLSERRLGKGLAGLRERAVIATKVGPDAMRGPDLVASVERSLGYLGTDYVDL